MNACKNLLFFCDFPNSLQPIAYSLSILWDATEDILFVSRRGLTRPLKITTLDFNAVLMPLSVARKGQGYIMTGMSQNWISQSANGVIITVHAVPRAAKDAVQGLYGNALKIRLHAPPVDGRANKVLLSFLSQALQVPLRCLKIKSGFNQRRKIIAISGLSKSETEKRLLNPK